MTSNVRTAFASRPSTSRVREWTETPDYFETLSVMRHIGYSPLIVAFILCSEESARQNQSGPAAHSSRGAHTHGTLLLSKEYTILS
jgi:hypothetical protein